MSKFTLLVVGLMLFASGVVGQDADQKVDSYVAVAIGTGGVAAGKSVTFNVRITQYTSDDQVQDLANLLKEKGQDSLRLALEKLTVGRVYPVGSVGNDIAVARKKKVGADTIITVVTARIMPFVELSRSSRTKDYPFGFLQLKLNDKGEGTGQIMVAARIRFDKKKGSYEIESYGNQYIKAINVRPSK